MNNTLDNTFEQDFNLVMKMSEKKYSYDELMQLLASDKIIEKQFAILELSEIRTQKDAIFLTSNLIGQDGKIREAVAYKLNEFVQNPKFSHLFIDENIFEILLEGLMDINGNVCRKIGDKWLENSDFQIFLAKKLPERIKSILAKIERLEANEKQYKISKRNFQLYWCLEALSQIIEIIDLKNINEILLKTAKFEDYTIREKTAKILTKITDSEFDKLKEKLKNDENLYVRRYFE